MRKIVLFLAVWALAGGGAQSGAQMLSEMPVATGGDPLGVWEADGTPLGVYADPALLAAVSGLSLSGSVTGQLDLDASGTYRSDYIVKVNVSLTVLGSPIALDFQDTVKAEGTYQVTETSLILRETALGLSDTLAFSASGDSLKLIQAVPLGQYASLVAALVPNAAPPLAVLSLARIDGGAQEPIEITADFNGNGRVDFNDFVQFASNFGRKQGQAGFDSRFDLSGNGEVDFVDFLRFARQFGRSA